MEKPSFEELFERGLEYPDFEYKERLDRLIGLDEQKQRLTKILSLLVNPAGIKKWADDHHKNALGLVHYVLKRPPLVVLEGDVGSGKSELAMTIGDSVARHEGISITLLPLSLSARGEGRVGQMTQLISAAFDYTIEKAEKLKSNDGKARGAVILLVDEGDALTQSRENSQMHHEDRAGVNAFIRGVDRIGNGILPAAVILCTNRLNAIDPAVKRRSADILRFTRPNETQRLAVLKPILEEIGFSHEEINLIVTNTGPQNGLEYGFTFSDLTQRLLPGIVLDAYPNQSINAKRALEIVQSMTPTPPFKEN